MFIEVNRVVNPMNNLTEHVLLNSDNIDYVTENETNGTAVIKYNEDTFTVIESFDQVKSMLETSYISYNRTLLS